MDPPYRMGPAQLTGFIMLPLLLLYIPSLIWFARRRNYHPIRGRHPNASLLFGVVAIVWHALLCLRFIFFDYIPCVLHVPLQRFAIEIFAHIYLYRLWLLYIEHHRLFRKKRLMKEQQLLGKEAAYNEQVPELENPNSLAYWASHRSSKQIKRLLLVTCFVLAIALTVVTMPFARPPPPLWLWGTRDCNIGPHSLSILGELVLFSAIFIYFSFKFARLDEDNFGLKSEFRAVGIIMIFNVLTSFIVSLVPALNALNNAVLPIQLLPVTIGVLVCFVTGITHIITLSYKSRTHLPIGRSSSFLLEQSGDFGSMLRHAECFQAFYQFLSREFAIENLLFWQQSVHLREAAEEKTRSINDLSDIVLQMHDLYFVPDMPLELNVSAATLQRVKEGVAEVRANPSGVPYETIAKVYLSAEQEIFKLMLHDPFPRFRQSPEYTAVAQIYIEARARNTMFHEVAESGSPSTSLDL